MNVMASNESVRYQLKAIVQHARPSIWRRIAVPGSLTLWELHLVLQVVFAWEEMHLHEFEIQKERYSDPANEEAGMRKSRDEHRFRIDRVVPRKIGFRFNYTYDFGDDWQVALLVEKILPPEENSQPTCLAGSRAGPLEDSGGPFGYMELIEALQDPNHPNHADSVEWAGEDFDPEAFDLDDTNRQLRELVESDYQIEVLLAGEDDDPGTLTASQERFFRSYMESLSPALQNDMTNLALRKDVIALITYLRDNPVKGTSSAGNLPLKAVRAIAPLFVKPPRLDYPGIPLRTEEDVPEIMFAHLLAFNAGLLNGGPAQRWEITDEGHVFLKIPPAAQLLQLLMNWIINIEWPIRSGSPDAAQNKANGLDVIQAVHRLPASKWKPFGPLAQHIAKTAGWDIANEPDLARKAAVRFAYYQIVEPLAAFGALEVRERREDFHHENTEIRITPLGKHLLGAASDMLSI